jgi:alpha-L-rhamnosidase
MIDQGATTMWERWDGYVKGRGFQNPGMNSFNHYSIGAVGEWIYRTILGINLDENEPGFKHIIIAPKPGGWINSCRGYYNSIYGKIEVAWRLLGKDFSLDIKIPVNTYATVFIPASEVNSVKEHGQSLSESESVVFENFENKIITVRVMAGEYNFQSTNVF